MANLTHKPPVASGAGSSGRPGFTLIELLVTLAIVGILSATVYPSYMKYISRASRAEAKGILMETAQFLERNYTVNNCYHRSDGPATCPPAVGGINATNMTLPYPYSPKSGNQKYAISVDYGKASGVPCTIGQCFTLSAAPLPTGPMKNDECKTLTLGSTGVQGANSTYGDPTQNANCWQK